ncbi:MAG: MBOAT family protein [Clostridiales bacterium]|jgi:alginate O-acetyltransferase complex protein AlgI|nr:MBOAT family protein [Clostridiales bacterium]
MVFSSAAFMFVFFPAVFVLYRFMPGIKAKNMLLTAASLVFYAAGQIEHLPLLLFSVLCNYIAGCLMTEKPDCRRAVLIGAAFVNLGLLGAYKYLGFLTANLNALFHFHIPEISIALPIGISFFTFQGLSYTIDVYRDKKAATRDFGKLLLYISFFPQLIAGPIVKYHDITEQIDARQCSAAMTADGLRRLIFGLSKKMLLANPLGRIADSVFALSIGAMDMRTAWLGAVCYALQIYFDFSGYSDMAVGLGKCFGFSFQENFAYPYAAASVQMFWRRWHISLSSWFRDYLYIPLGGSRKGAARRAINKAAVFFCTGLWHGASWTFVIWGLWHGFFILLEDVLPIKKGNRFLGNIYTLLVTVCGFVIFRADSAGQAWAMLIRMFGGFRPASANAAAIEAVRRAFNGYNGFVFAAAVLAAAGCVPAIRRVCQEKAARWLPLLDAGAYCAVLPLLLASMMSIASSNFNPFIYFRF